MSYYDKGIWRSREDRRPGPGSNLKRRERQAAAAYDCSKCPGYCCSVYSSIEVTESDLDRLAKHLRLPLETATHLCARDVGERKALRRRTDDVFESACIFLDPLKHNCTIYEARPEVCRHYPGQSHCPYYDLIRFERDIQQDPNVVVKVSFWHDPSDAS